MREIENGELHQIGEFLGIPILSRSKCLDLAGDPLHRPTFWEAIRINSKGADGRFGMSLVMVGRWLEPERVIDANVERAGDEQGIEAGNPPQIEEEGAQGPQAVEAADDAASDAQADREAAH